MYYQSETLENLDRIFDQNRRQDYLRLDLNENPQGLPGEFVERVLSGITPGMVAQYPETASFSRSLADSLGTDPSRLCLTNGSAEAIRYIFQAFTAPGGRIVGVVPSYFMFQVYSRMYDRVFVPVTYGEEDLRMDVARILDALTADTQLLILMNPNNPVGNTYSREELEQVIGVCRDRQITLLIDEAYYGFCRDSFLEYALKGKHIFVTRSFSKLFSMAGCRLGYAAGWPEGIRLVQKLCTPHNVNVFALAFAEAILKEPGLLRRLTEEYQAGRALLIRELDARGYPHLGKAGNFLFIRPRTDAHRLVQRMKQEKKILTKAYDGLGSWGTCLRVTVAAPSCMERFLEALWQLDR